MNEDWRLSGQERYLTKARLEWRTWKQQQPDWDHDHCEFCTVKFGQGGPGEEVAEAGWSTSDGDHWICDPCAKDFASLFQWDFASTDDR